MNYSQVQNDNSNSTVKPSTCPIDQSLALWLLVGTLAIIVILIVFIVVRECLLCRRGTMTLTDTKTESFKIQVPFFDSVDRDERIEQINERIETAVRLNSAENLHTKDEWNPLSPSSAKGGAASTPLTPIPVPTPSVPLLTPAALRTPAAIPEGSTPAKRKHPEIPQVTPSKAANSSPLPEEGEYDEAALNVKILRISEAVEDEPHGEIAKKEPGHVSYVNCRRAFGPRSEGEHDYYNAVRMNMLSKHL